MLSFRFHVTFTSDTVTSTPWYVFFLLSVLFVVPASSVELRVDVYARCFHHGAANFGRCMRHVAMRRRRHCEHTRRSALHLTKATMLTSDRPKSSARRAWSQNAKKTRHARASTLRYRT